jgi:hypothetical protein
MDWDKLSGKLSGAFNSAKASAERNAPVLRQKFVGLAGTAAQGAKARPYIASCLQSSSFHAALARLPLARLQPAVEGVNRLA